MNQFLRRFFASKPKTISTRSRPLAVEVLESREVPATYAWSQTAAGTYNWNDAANWGGAGFPNAIDDVADLSTVNLAGNVTITINSNIKVGQLKLGDTSGTQTYTLASSGAGVLTIDVGSGAGLISKVNGGGADSIQAPIALADDTVLDNGTATALTIAGVISGAGGIEKTGSGTVGLVGAGTYSGATRVTAGTLKLAAPTAPTIQNANFSGPTTADFIYYNSMSAGEKASYVWAPLNGSNPLLSITGGGTWGIPSSGNGQAAGLQGNNSSAQIAQTLNFSSPGT